MDPIAASSSSAALRPVAPQADLRAVLAEGRVVAGEVLATLDGGTLLIGVGGQRVPAESRVDLAPGQRFLARVETADGELVLHVLAPDEPEAPLVRLLRAALADERPAGQRLADLLRALGGRPAGARLAEHAFDPGADGAALRARVEHGGLSLERVLAALAGAPDPALARELAARGLASHLAGGLEREQRAPGLLPLLERELAGWRPRPGPGADAIGALAALLRALAARDGVPPRVAEALRRLAVPAGGELPAQGTAALSVLAGEAPPAELAAFVRAALCARAKGDLKARVAAVLAGDDAGEAGPALSAALRAIEAEQLINVVRRESDQGWQAGVPVPDADGFATACLRAPKADVPREDARDGEGAPAAAEPCGRLSLEVDLSRLGPVRAELWLRARELCLRITCAEASTAAALERELDAVREELAPLGGALRCTIAVGAPAGPRPGAEDLRWLERHPLMDLAG